mgnify:CR=1 FL=1
MKKKIVYIAHPIGGDVLANLEDLVRILRIINTNSHKGKLKFGITNEDIVDNTITVYQDNFDFSNVVPIAPYYADILALDDANPLERKRGIENCIALITTGAFDELWLTGTHISLGMREEVTMFVLQGKPVIDYTNKI